MSKHERGAPPRATNPDGAPRRVGVEIEYAGVSAHAAADMVQRLFGGAVRVEDAHRFHVEGAEFGDFVCELDVQYAHRPDGEPEDEETVIAWFRRAFRAVLGDLSSTIMPCEIVCPPVEHTALDRLDALVEALNGAGALGTRTNPLYAFGVQLNPEIASADAAYIAATLKAFLLAEDWLRAAMRIDITRRLTGFADSFPPDYVARVVDPAYWPDRSALIDDYLAFNPTRNRSLDLLPLFAWLDPERVRRVVDDRRVKPRPTFHYRLPDANIGEPGWSIILEWRRWLIVERLAEAREALADMAQEFARAPGDQGRAPWPIAFSERMLLAEV